jgi:bifunctional NMN adenylyltransferase/nudix hydrolase
MSMTKVAFVIGRFQPFHLGHKAMVDHALSVADRVIVFMGDTGCALDARDPWTLAQLAEMIHSVYQPQIAAGKLTIASLLDIPYDDKAWSDQVIKMTDALIIKAFGLAPADCDVFAVGHVKDTTSFYLNEPSWHTVKSPTLAIATGSHDTKVIDATPIREEIIRDGVTLLKGTMGQNAYATNFGLLPLSVVRTMAGWPELVTKNVTADYEATVRFNAEYSSAAVKKWGKPHLHAVDAAVFCDGHVLVVRRAGGSGQGALALPGGFLDNDEWPVIGALRELLEETTLDLRSHYGDLYQKPLITYANPRRSRRGRTITHVLVHHLVPLNGVLPKVAVGDPKEVSEVFWLPLSALDAHRHEFFSDHFHIVKDQAAWLLP